MVLSKAGATNSSNLIAAITEQVDELHQLARSRRDEVLRVKIGELVRIMTESRFQVLHSLLPLRLATISIKDAYMSGEKERLHEGMERNLPVLFGFQDNLIAIRVELLGL